MPKYKPKQAPKFELGPKKKGSPKYMKVVVPKKQKVETTSVRVQYTVKGKKGLFSFNIKVPSAQWTKKTPAQKKKYVQSEIAKNTKIDPKRITIKGIKKLKV